MTKTKYLDRDTKDLQILLNTSEVKSIIWNKVMGRWQRRWDTKTKGGFLHRFNSAVKYHGDTRKERVTYSIYSLYVYVPHTSLDSLIPEVFGRIM